MAFPPITNLPAAPSRDQTPENFSSTADAFVAALPDFVSDVNAAGDYIDTKTISVGNDFQGNYSAGTTYNLGQSVLYSDIYYISLVDSNTGNTPDSSPSDWSEIVTGGGGGSAGTVDFVASGSITNGDVVVINSDGTVSVGLATASGPVARYEEGVTSFQAAAYDSNSNKVVIAYTDSTTNDHGTAVVGTVSGASISFGTPVAFNTDPTYYLSATFDSSSNKVVIAYTDYANSNYGTAIVGTVSGTSISFGTPVVFESGNSQGYAATFDSSSNKVVIAYEDTANAAYGTAVVGTVSGTSISFGTPVVYNSADSDQMSATFDSNSNKVVVAYRDRGNSNYGTAIVGTVSGTSISFGTPVVFESQSSLYSSVDFDPDNNKVVITYQGGAGAIGNSIVATVSGTSISFGSPTSFGTLKSFSDTVYDPVSNKMVVFYKSDSTDRTYAAVGTVSGTSISFRESVELSEGAEASFAAVFDTSAERFAVGYALENSRFGSGATFTVGNDQNGAMGLATQDVSDGESVSVTTLGGVNESQSGLSIGSVYYVGVSTAGGLTTTATEGPKVGRAIAVDKILVTEG